eukprot:g34022.t1
MKASLLGSRAWWQLVIPQQDLEDGGVVANEPRTRPGERWTNVIYKISCRDCDKHYIGQTGRKSTTRVHEHQYSLISIHMDKKNHKFDWDNTKILGQAKQRQAWEFLEAW